MKTPRHPHPSIKRLFLGFFLAPLVPALLYGVTASAFNGMEGAAFISFVAIGLVVAGYPATLVLGVPAYLILRRYLAPSPANYALVGGVIAALPWFSGTFFVLGVIGGLVFWLCTIWRTPAMARAPDGEGSASASGSNP